MTGKLPPLSLKGDSCSPGKRNVQAALPGAPRSCCGRPHQVRRRLPPFLESWIFLRCRSENEGVAHVAEGIELGIAQVTFQREAEALGHEPTGEIVGIAPDLNAPGIQDLEGHDGLQLHRFSDITGAHR